MGNSGRILWAKSDKSGLIYADILLSQSNVKSKVTRENKHDHLQSVYKWIQFPVMEVGRLFAAVKVLIAHGKNTPLPVKDIYI